VKVVEERADHWADDPELPEDVNRPAAFRL